MHQEVIVIQFQEQTENAAYKAYAKPLESGVEAETRYLGLLQSGPAPCHSWPLGTLSVAIFLGQTGGHSFTHP